MQSSSLHRSSRPISPAWASRWPRPSVPERTASTWTSWMDISCQIFPMGAAIVRSLRRVTRLPLEAHLMISNPDFFVDEFAQAGTDSFLVHWEGNNDLSRTVQRIKALGKRVGVAINPATSAAVLEEIMQDLDQILVMTVNPGFGHQHFLPATLPK